MSQTTRDIIKSYFETGDRPTQQQFADWIESCRWYDEAAGDAGFYIAEINRNQITGNPIVIELANTLGATPVWSKVGETMFKAVIAGGFVMGRTFASVSCIETDTGYVNPVNNDNNTILVGAIHCIVKIEVYPN